MRRMRAVVVVVALALALTACGDGTTGSSVPGERVPFVIRTDAGEVTLSVETADSEEERARGLMGRPEVPDDGGMRFLFDGPTRGSFWMRDTLIPLSIAFWGADGRIVAILDMPLCREEDCPEYSPGVDFVGALEVRRGLFAERGVAVGDLVTVGARG
ncbi:MAG: DUF192 domain-containing protein [Actinomycetota bacterium]